MRTKSRFKKASIKKISMSLLAIVMAVTFLISSLPKDTYQILAATKTADANTTGKYMESLGNNDTTEWAGRIWTDKTVYSQDAVFANENITVENDSDFLVSYSALATTQEIKGGIASPVDVVFVIDVSGSMTSEMGTGNDDDDESRISNTIEALNNSIHSLMSQNEYNRIGVVTFSKNDTEVLPLARWTTSNTSTSNGTTRYNYFSVNGSTITVNATSKTNGISRRVNSVSVTGGTNIQKGMYAGMNMLANATNITVDINGTTVKRTPSLVLLSDGAPTFSVRTENWWAPDTDEIQGPGSSAHYGNGMLAMMTGAYMKQVVDAKYAVANTASRTKIYTIGMGLDSLSGNDLNLARVTLNPEDYYNANNTMSRYIRNAFNTYASGRSVDVEVNSSNSSGSNENDTLRTRTINHPTQGTIDVTSIEDYVDAYYSASSASSVNEVFSNIIDSITVSSAMAPTEITKGDPFESGEGDVVYTDPIGKYMEVKDVKAIIYAGQKYEVKQTTTKENEITYVFEGSVNNAVYGEHDLSEIQITVTVDADGNQTLEVRMPAGAMPLRVNKVELNSDNSVKSHTNNGAYPVRVLYSVGVKNEIINNGVIDSSKVSQEYISANRNEDGTVNFYSNLYTGKTTIIDGADTTIGDATVTFKPALNNPFYYVQEPIDIYTNSELTEKLSARTEIRDNATYYYKDVYYQGNNRVERAIARTGVQLKQVEVEESNGYWVRPVGTPRKNRMFHFKGTKDKNDTKTAAEFYTPIFESDQVVVHLGNNGVLMAMVGGSLSISKTVTADAGLTAPDKEFTFAVTLRDSDSNALSGNYEYIVADEEGNAVTDNEGSPITGTVGNNGTIRLKAGQTATILDLPVGTTYEVVETAVDGFTSKVGTTQTDRAFGEIVSGEKEKVTFTNNYSVASVTIPATTAFPGKKVLEGRQWANGDSFIFRITPAEGSPAPEHTTVTVTNKDAKNSEADFNFGSVTFEKPGTYKYLILEQAVAAEDRLSGITYSLATYEVTIEVVDNGEGELEVESNNMVQIQNDRGYEIRAIAAEEAVFTNIYSPEEVKWGPLGTKIYTDNSGQKPLTDGMFTFAIKAVGENAAEAPMPDALTPDKNGESFVTNIENVFHFEQATFTHEMIGETFTYQVREVIPEGATTSDNGKTYTYEGMIYDGTIHTVTVQVTYEDPNIVIIPTYDQGDRIVFENTYTPEEVILGSDTNAPISGVKTLTGRDMNDGETFGFTLEAANQTTTQAITDEVVILEKSTATVEDGENGKAVAFDFGKTTFKKPGTYIFNVKETKGESKGVTYDSHVCTVTVEVTDNNGKLIADVTYNNGTGNADTKAEFLNTYQATFDDSTTVNLNGTKNLVGDILGAGEYYFTIEPQNNAPMGASFTNNPNEAGTKNNDGSYTGNITLLKNIKYTEAGTYTYIIKENIPTDKRGGITYDESVYEVTVVVVDDNNGNLKTNKPVIKKKNDGNESNAEEIVFNNSYEATPAVLVPARMLKVLEGDRSEPLKDNEFQFEMKIASATTEGGVTLPNPSVVGNAADGTVQFGEIKFTEPGTYVLQVAEVIPNDNEKVVGVTYDEHVIQATITVTDNNEGKLIAVLTHLTGNYSFTNVYKTTGTLIGTTNLKVTKNFTGRENNNWLDTDEFRFILVPNNTATEEAIANGDVVLPDNAGEIKITANDSPKEASFGDITFNAVGQYEFRIRERTDSPIEGINYDSDSRVVTVTTTDNNDGTLTVTAEVTSEKDLTFNNIYKPEDTTLYGHHDLMLTKNFTGRENDEWLDTDEFTFKIEAAGETTRNAVASGDIIMPQSDEIVVTKENKNHIHFGDIIFSKSGDYTFTITEVDKGIEGIKYDTKPRNIIVNVVDNNDATMTATVAENSDELVFNNTYSTEEVSLEGTTNLEITKELSGRDWSNEDSFEFLLSPNDDVTKTAIEENVVILTNDKITISKDNKTKAFGDITFYKPGEYSFNIEEIPGNIEGIDYDTDEATVIVIVEDNKKGKLEITSIETLGSMTFNNVYTPNSVELIGEENLKVTKVLSGRDWFEDDIFEFTLSVTDPDTSKAIEEGDVVLPRNKTIEISGKDNNKEKAFGNITFNKTGTYKFNISETKGNVKGINYDEHPAVVTVVVTDNQVGQLVAAASTTEGNMTFTNTYTPQPITETLSGTKKMSGRELMDTDVFGFTITKASDSIADTPMPDITTAENDKDGNITFAPITYTKAGTYSYIIKETSGSAPGVVNDLHEVRATVEVTYDSATGTLSSDVTYDGEGFVFTNKYDADPTDDVTGFTAKKKIKASDGNSYELKGGEFEFSITPSANNPASDPVNAKTVTNDKNGNVSLVYSEVIYDAPGEYVYTVKEISDKQLAGIGYDSSIYTITVNVVDNKQTGKLEGTLVITKDDKTVDEIVFENNYNPTETSVNLSGKKVLEGKALETGEFKFKITGKDQAPMPAEDTVTNVEGEFQFDAITYTKPGTYSYTISEVNEGKLGYSYDDNVYDIQVTVSDEDGELKAQVTGNDNIVFNNTYKPTPVTLKDDTALKGTKKLTGRPLNEGEFTFQLVDENQKVVSEVNNSADGSFAFEELTFEKAGTYYYTILEKINGVGGIGYDTNSYTVEIQVEDKGGYLEAVTKYLDQGKEIVESVIFENTYTPQSTSIQIGATKKLTGRDMKAKEFTFVLKDENGNVIATATNDEVGVILFDKIVYDKEGTYTYTISEEKGTVEDITYDDTVYTITVTVKDSLQGYLEATIDYEGKELVFNNSYDDGSEENPNENPKEDPTKDPGKGKINKGKTSPKTSNYLSTLITMIIFGILSMLVMVKIVLIGKRERKYKSQ